jgi:hypothetical protein
VYPDIIVNLPPEGPAILQRFEIHSCKEKAHECNKDDYCSTIRKLSISLAEQLRCLRQLKPEQMSISGFYLPSGVFGNKPIELVTCYWVNLEMKFMVSCQVCQSGAAFDTELYVAHIKSS